MERITKFKTGIATLFLTVVFMFLSSCKELSGTPDWPDIYGKTWESSNGNVQFNVGELSGNSVSVGAAGYFSLKYYDDFYFGYFPISILFGGSSTPLDYVLGSPYDDDPVDRSGEIILIKKNNNSITVEFTGAISVPAVQLYKKDLVQTWNVSDR